MNKNPYDILEVSRAATDDEIKKAYKKLAIKYHPDKNPGDLDAEAKFKEISNAYDEIKNGRSKKYTGKNSRRDHASYDFDFDEWYKKWERVRNDFGDNSWREFTNSNRTHKKAMDIHATIDISLENAYYGSERNIFVGMNEIKINIPKGIRNKERLKIKGKGQVGYTDDLNGDLIITVNILKNDKFLRDDSGLYAIEDIDFYDLILGGEYEILVFDRKIKYKIPPNTKSGSMLRLKGKGFPIKGYDEKYDDLYIKVNGILPSDLSQKEIELFKQLKKLKDSKNDTD